MKSVPARGSVGPAAPTTSLRVNGYLPIATLTTKSRWEWPDPTLPRYGTDDFMTLS